MCQYYSGCFGPCTIGRFGGWDSQAESACINYLELFSVKKDESSACLGDVIEESSVLVAVSGAERVAISFFIRGEVFTTEAVVPQEGVSALVVLAGLRFMVLFNDIFPYRVVVRWFSADCVFRILARVRGFLSSAAEAWADDWGLFKFP